MPLPAVLVTPWPPSRTAQVLHPRRACSSGGCFSADLVRASVALFKSSCFSKGRKQSHCLGTRSLTTASRSYPASCPPRAGLSSAAHLGTLTSRHLDAAAGLLNAQAASPLLPTSSCSSLGSSLCGASPAPHGTVCAARWTFSSIELSSVVSLGNKLIHGCSPASSPCWAHGVLASTC